MQQRRDEILAKKAKLAELKRQRELRQSQASAGRQSLGGQTDTASHSPGRAENRREIETLINSLVGDSRPGSTVTGGAGSPAQRGSRPNSVLSADQFSNDTSEVAPGTAAPTNQREARTALSLNTVPLTTVFACPPSPVKEVFSYSKGVQTTEDWTSPIRTRAQSTISNDEDIPGTTTTPSKRLSRRERDLEEGLRQQIRDEVREELMLAKDPDTAPEIGAAKSRNYPMRDLTAEELDAVMQSDDFVDFLDQSTKIIERAIEQETYDILTDYALQGQDHEDETEESGNNVGGRGRHRVKEVAQFFDERWSKKRMVSGIDFSPKFSELLLASYTKNPTAPHEPDGLVQVWNLHMQDRPEYVFTAQSDVLAAKFSPYHPNLIVGGSYSGQVLLWDTRAKAAPVQKTPLTGFGHAHPIYSVDIVGTQNANNIISCSTDGVVCGWSMDVFAQPQELLELKNPTQAKITVVEDVSPTCVSFPQTDPTFFLVGSEEGTIFPCHRYDRAGAKAGVDKKISYRGHTAPVMSVDFHPSRGPIDLGDLVLSSSLDWSVKLWKVRAPAATSTISAGDGNISPLMEFVREDLVYDARWSPAKPSVFALVDGAGWLELWDLAVETEEPISRISPSSRQESRAMLSKSLNKVAWEPNEGKRLATGGIDGALTVFEVGSGLGGKENLKNEDWANMKKLINRVEAVGGQNGAVVA